MGLYLNPGNEAFRQIRRGIYVDKTDLIDFINSTIETPAKLTCFSRPRRFGKSFAAKMLCAYYDKSCDSRQNDMTSFHSKDDVLTLLIHLGYLAYDSKTYTATIPNLEVADAFGDAVSGEGWDYVKDTKKHTCLIEEA